MEESFVEGYDDDDSGRVGGHGMLLAFKFFWVPHRKWVHMLLLYTFFRFGSSRRIVEEVAFVVVSSKRERDDVNEPFLTHFEHRVEGTLKIKVR